MVNRELTLATKAKYREEAQMERVIASLEELLGKMAARTAQLRNRDEVKIHPANEYDKFRLRNATLARAEDYFQLCQAHLRTIKRNSQHAFNLLKEMVQ